MTSKFALPLASAAIAAIGFGIYFLQKRKRLQELQQFSDFLSHSQLNLGQLENSTFLDEKKNVEKLIEEHIKIYGVEPDLVVRSPGRINLIGEHTE